MEPILVTLTIIFAILSVALVATLAVEIIEYRRYVKAAHALIALGEGIKVTMNSIITELNRQEIQSGVLGQSLNLTDQEVVFIKNILQIHSEALGLDTGRAFKLQDKFQGVARNGEDPTREIQG